MLEAQLSGRVVGQFSGATGNRARRSDLMLILYSIHVYSGNILSRIGGK